jgi:Kef-type K+ transport system membrane component KefB
LSHINLILNSALLLLAGFTIGKLVNKLKLPAVTGYLIAGIIMGPSILNVMTPQMNEAATILSHLALSLIAFNIGSQFTIRTIKSLGKSVVWITFLEAFGASIVVTLAMYFLADQPLHIAMLFGAIAAATAPAATIMVIRETKAKGTFTDTLLAVVAIDDPVCVILFAIASGFASLTLHNAGVSPFMVFLDSILGVIYALLVGIGLGLLLTRVIPKIKTPAELQTLSLGLIILGSGLAIQWNLSPLLVNMALGSAIANLSHRADSVIDKITALDTPLYVLFFTLSGASLNLSSLKEIGLVGIIYVVFRVIGKMLGSTLGAYISDADENVKKYLGLGLVPQAGVALGLALIAKQTMPEIGEFIHPAIVSATVIYELIGPPLAKFALIKAGDAKA